jgi:sigma-B regulation protein RsbU (phosphoserine phosphatase)
MLQPAFIQSSADGRALAVDDAPVLGAAACILVVDDSLANRSSLSRLLTASGYGALTAADGDEALAILERQPVDLVLLDVMMPGRSGLEVLEEIRRTRSPADLPVIMATARDASDDIVRALESGANDYITKPLDFAVVFARARTHITLKNAIAEARALDRRLQEQNAELQQANAQLRLAAERSRRDLLTASRVQSALLPAAAPDFPALRFAWAFQPCEQLAGDAFNTFALSRRHASFYVLDVSGHGVAASLLAVAATRLLSPAHDREALLLANADDCPPAPTPPHQVAARLNAALPWSPATQQFLTLFYATYDVHTSQLLYTSAGHPGAIKISLRHPPQTLDGSDLPIGIGEEYHSEATAFLPGDRLFVYSDGVTEAFNPRGEIFTKSRLVDALTRTTALPLQQALDDVLREIQLWRQGSPATDDLTLLAIECC